MYCTRYTRKIDCNSRCSCLALLFHENNYWLRMLELWTDNWVHKLRLYGPRGPTQALPNIYLREVNFLVISTYGGYFAQKISHQVFCNSPLLFSFVVFFNIFTRKYLVRGGQLFIDLREVLRQTLQATEILTTPRAISCYLRDDMPFKVHSMFINLYQLKARRGAEEWVTIATLVPEEDTLNSCTRSRAKVLSKLKFLDPITESLGMTMVSCIREGRWDSKR